MGYTYKPGYTTGTTAPETAQKTGLGTAKNVLENNVKKTHTYKDDISGKLKGPVTKEYVENVGYKPMKTVGALTDGDYQKLQDNLQAPIFSHGQKAQQKVKEDYGGRGLYGSVGGGLMSGAQSHVQEATENALSGAVANRYAIELKDKAQQIDQNKALFSTNASTADQINAYNRAKLGWDVSSEQAKVDFDNAILEMSNRYGMDKEEWMKNIDMDNFQNALALAGLANPAVSSNQNNKLAKDQMKANNQTALYGGIGRLAGGLMGSYDGSGDSGWNFDGIKDTVSSWF